MEHPHLRTSPNRYVVHPEGDGFAIAEVCRAEVEALSYANDVLGQLLTDLHLTATETTVRPVWSFARPPVS